MKKTKIKVNNKLKGSLGQMNPKTNQVEINVRAHKGDKAELASTIAHELMHVKKPHATEKEVYKATAKTKIPPAEQSKLLATLRHKTINYRVGVAKRSLGMKGKVNPGDLISKMNERKIKRKIDNQTGLSKERLSIMGLV